MNRLFSIMCTMAVGLSVTGTARAVDMMSFGFSQEMAGITSQGEIKADIIGGGLSAATIRVGAFGGEVMIDSSGANGIGYKASINPNVGAYGMLYFDSVSSTTNIQGGASYSKKSADLIYNLNGHFASLAGATTLSVNGAAFYTMSQRKVGGKVYIGGEVLLELSPTTATTINVGLRWMPKRNLIVDTGLITSTGAGTTIATPAFVRLNIGL